MGTPSARLRLRVVPRARHGAAVGRLGRAWKVGVAAAPERGEPNAALVDLLASAVAVPARCIRLVSRHGGRDKMVEFDGISGAELERRLAAAERKDLP